MLTIRPAIGAFQAVEGSTLCFIYSCFRIEKCVDGEIVPDRKSANLFKLKATDMFNHKNALSILRIKNWTPTKKLGEFVVFGKALNRLE